MIKCMVYTGNPLVRTSQSLALLRPFLVFDDYIHTLIDVFGLFLDMLLSWI